MGMVLVSIIIQVIMIDEGRKPASVHNRRKPTGTTESEKRNKHRQDLLVHF